MCECGPSVLRAMRTVIPSNNRHGMIGTSATHRRMENETTNSGVRLVCHVVVDTVSAERVNYSAMWPKCF